MTKIKNISEPLRINNSGKYELYDYVSAKQIAVSSALLLDPYFENNLHTTVKIINKETQIEFDRFMLLAFVNPSLPKEDRIEITGKFFDPKKHYLKIEPKNGSDEVLFMLSFRSGL
jgi:hypothetical protein